MADTPGRNGNGTHIEEPLRFTCNGAPIPEDKPRFRESPPSLSAWLNEARRYLQKAYGQVKGAVTITVKDASGSALRYRMADSDLSLPVPSALSPLERSIAEAILADVHKKLTAKQIAARLRVPNAGGFRAVLSNLTERIPPVLESSPHGYSVVRENTL